MRVRSVFFAVMILVLVLAVWGLATDVKWFDTEKCAFCKQIAKYPGLAEHMHHEYHNISNGIVSITTVDEDYKEAYYKSQADIQKVAEDMTRGGEMPYMCGFCSKYGYFLMAGVKQEVVESDVGIILIMQSDDKEMVKELHDFADRAKVEMKKMFKDK